MAYVVNHLYQIIHIDDKLLVYLYKLLIHSQKIITLDGSLQTDRSFAARYHSLPAPYFMIVLKEGDVTLVNQFEIYGIGIEQKLVVALLAVLHFLLAVACGCHFLQSAHYRCQFFPVYGLEQYIEGFFAEGGRIRGVPVTIGGSSYVPPLPNELDVKDKILEIIGEEDDAINIAIRLCLYCMKTQIFLDGNKRASVIFANHYLIAHGGGFLVIPESEVPEFKKLLVKYYEGEDSSVIAGFMKERCWKTIGH